MIGRHNSAVYIIDLISGPNLLEVRSPGMGTVLMPLWFPTHPKGTQVYGRTLCISKSGCDQSIRGDQDCTMYCRLQLQCTANAVTGQRGGASMGPRDSGHHDRS